MIVISPKIVEKLREKHGVTESEVAQCFENRTGHLLMDSREQHRTDPPTMWFVAPTNKARLLKVCFINRDGTLFVRSVFAPNEIELLIYRKSGLPSDF